MTLLTAVLAAVIATAVWYASENARRHLVGVLALMYWGASLMWFVDAVFEYAELRTEYFTPAAGDMLNDFFLGLSVVALGLVIWLVILMVRDPDGVVYKAMHKTK